MGSGTPIGSVLMLLGFIAVIVFFMTLPAKRKKQAKQKAQLLDKELHGLRSNFIVVTGSIIPTKEIKSVLGSVTGISETEASTKEQFSLSEKEAMLALIRSAQKLGANAIIDLQMNTGTYEQQGSKWQVSQAIYTGTAVIIEQ